MDRGTGRFHGGRARRLALLVVLTARTIWWSTVAGLREAVGAEGAVVAEFDQRSARRYAALLVDRAVC